MEVEIMGFDDVAPQMIWLLYGGARLKDQIINP
jgi:hypothetical protein